MLGAHDARQARAISDITISNAVRRFRVVAVKEERRPAPIKIWVVGSLTGIVLGIHIAIGVRHDAPRW